MSKDKIKLGVQVDGIDEIKKVVKEVDNLKDSVGSAGEAVEGLGGDFSVLSDARNKVLSLIALFKALKGGLNSLGSKAKNSIGKISQGFKSMGNSAKSGFGKASKGLKKVNLSIKTADFSLKGMKKSAIGTFRAMKAGAISAYGSIVVGALSAAAAAATFLVASGIGIFLLALGAVVAYFATTEKGAMKLKKALSTIGIVVNTIIKGFADFASTMKLAFTSPRKAIRKFMGDIGDAKKEINNASKAADELVEAQERLRKQLNKSTVENAQYNKTIEVQTKLAEDSTASFEDRAKALDKADVARKKLANSEKNALDNTIKGLEATLKNTVNISKQHELEEEIASSKAERSESETAASISLLDSKQLHVDLEQEQEDKRKEYSDAAKGREDARKEMVKANIERLESISKLVEDSNVDFTATAYEQARIELKIARDSALEELENLKATEKEKLALIEGFNNQETELNRKRLEEIEGLILEHNHKTINNQLLANAIAINNEEVNAIAKAKSLEATESDLEAIRKGFENKRITSRLEFLKELQDLSKDEIIDSFDKLLDEERIYYEKQAKLLEDGFASGMISQSEYDGFKLEQIQKHNNKVNSIEKDRTDSRLKIIKDREEKALEILAGYSVERDDEGKSEFDIARDNLNEEYDEKERLLKEHLANNEINQEQYNKVIVDLEGEKVKKLAEIAKAEKTAKREQHIENVQIGLDIAQGVADAIQAVTDDQVARIERENKTEQDSLDLKIESSDKEKELLQQKLDNGEISESEYKKQLDKNILSRHEFEKQKVILDNKANAEANKVKKKAFLANKAMQIANTAMDTFKGASGAFASLSSIPVVGVPLGIAAAAAATVAGLARIKTIAQTKFEPTAMTAIPSPPSLGSSGASAGSSVSGTSSPSSAPVPSSITLFGQANGSSVENSDNQLGTNQQTIKAYVVESEITESQQRINQYQQRSEIG